MVDVYILVLHWQGSNYTRACLASLQALTYPRYRVVLIDNGSADGSGKLLAGEFPSVELIDCPSNLGFSGGCNAGINYCMTRGAKWIWLLNNDTRVSAGSLSTLMKVADENQRAGALGALVITGSGDKVAASGAGEIDWRRAKTFLRKSAPDGMTPVECEWLSGSNLLLRADALAATGTFNDNYFLYFEDTELCWRLRRYGWNCLFVPQAKIEHTGGASTEGNLSNWRAYYYTRNRLLFFSSCSCGLSRLLGIGYIALHLIRHIIVLPFRGKQGRKQLKAELLGLKDYLLKRFGKAACL